MKTRKKENSSFVGIKEAAEFLGCTAERVKGLCGKRGYAKSRDNRRFAIPATAIPKN